VGGSLSQRLPAVLHVGAEQKWMALVAQSGCIVDAQHQIPGVEVGPRGGQAGRLRERKEVGYVGIGQAHLFSEAVPPQLLVKFDQTPRLEGLVMPVQRLLASLKDLRDAGRETEVQLAGLPNPFQGPEKVDAILP